MFTTSRMDKEIVGKHNKIPGIVFLIGM
jgi:hypothetical protein